MTTNAEKLARELIALNERYSAKDFDRASELLRSGELFERAVKTARIASAGAGASVISNGSRKGGKSARTSASSATTKANMYVQLDLKNLLTDLIDDDRSSILSFAEKFQNRSILRDAPAARIFAQRLGLELPKTLPPRAILLKSIVARLRELTPDNRAEALLDAERIGKEGSALQRWSDLIVKNS